MPNPGIHDDGNGLFFHQLQNWLNAQESRPAVELIHGPILSGQDKLQLQLLAALVDGVRGLTHELKVDRLHRQTPASFSVATDHDIYCAIPRDRPGISFRELTSLLRLPGTRIARVLDHGMSKGMIASYLEGEDIPGTTRDALFVRIIKTAEET